MSNFNLWRITIDAKRIQPSQPLARKKERVDLKLHAISKKIQGGCEVWISLHKVFIPTF